MDLKGHWQVRGDLESLSRDLTAGQPFLGKTKKKRKKRSLDPSYPQQCKGIKGAMLVADRAHWISMAPKDKSLFSPPGFNPDYPTGFQIHENLNLRNLWQFRIKNFLKMQAKSNQQFGTLASSACLDSLWLLLL